MIWSTRMVFLSTYGDLSMLVGPRYMRVTRLLSSDSWYSASIVFVARQICALDDDLTAPPAPRAAVAAVAAVAAGAVADVEAAGEKLSCSDKGR